MQKSLLVNHKWSILRIYEGVDLRFFFVFFLILRVHFQLETYSVSATKTFRDL